MYKWYHTYNHCGGIPTCDIRQQPIVVAAIYSWDDFVREDMYVIIFSCEY